MTCHYCKLDIEALGVVKKYPDLGIIDLHRECQTPLANERSEATIKKRRENLKKRK